MQLRQRQLLPLLAALLVLATTSAVIEAAPEEEEDGSCQRTPSDSNRRVLDTEVEDGATEGQVLEEGSCSVKKKDAAANAAVSASTHNDDDDDDTSLQQRIVDWVVEAGGYFHPKQKFRRAVAGDPDSYFGIFATEDIQEGELLAVVPGRCVISGWDDDVDGTDGDYFFCGTTQLLLEEMSKGEDSFFAPHTAYLRKQSRGTLPSDWSEAGRSLLLSVLGADSTHMEEMLPPTDPTVLINEYKRQCHGRQKNDNEEDKNNGDKNDDDNNNEGDDEELDEIEIVASFENLRRANGEDLIPLFDLYNHANGHGANAAGRDYDEDDDDDDDDDYKDVADDVVRQKLYATRDITAGEQICFSYNQSPHLVRSVDERYGTPDLLRDYGFVEAMPQRWVFPAVETGFDLFLGSTSNDANDEDGSSGGGGSSSSNDKLELQWLDWMMGTEFMYEHDAYFRRHWNRIVHSVEPTLEQIENKLHSVIANAAPAAAADGGGNEGIDNHQGTTTQLLQREQLPLPNELATVRDYVSAVKVAIEEVLRTLNEVELSQTPYYREIRVKEHGPRGHLNHENFPTYNEEYYPVPGKDRGWVLLDREKSVYQDISFMAREDDNTVCFLLDGMPQTCSCFSPHYHDIAAHYPTRYLDQGPRRVAILGGGDSKMLQEMYKYNETLQLVIQLELDQKAVRKCFKYFATEPHFDDDRVQWYFGDAARSLRMLPVEYFGTFDLVFVDLSESGPLSFAVSDSLTVWDSIVQLLSPHGILVKNELYSEMLNEVFDHTMLLYYENVPLIESWALTFGTNRKDLLNPNPLTMQKWHDVKTHLDTFHASPTDLDDHYYLAHDYQHNDAREQGKCERNTTATSTTSSSSTEDNRQTLEGILLVLDAERTKASSGIYSDAWSKIESSLTVLLKDDHGLRPLSSVSHTSVDDYDNDGNVVGAIILMEGVVVVRTWPKEKYCAFDVQLWGAFNKLERLKRSLAKFVGSEEVSSFRVVTTGIRGTDTESRDRGIIGPPGISNRDCDEVDTDDSDGIVIDTNIVEAVTKASLGMIQEKGGSIVVLCGSESESCPAFSAAISFSSEDEENLFHPVALWACPSVETVNQDLTRLTIEDMAACDAIVSKQLADQVSQHGMVVGFVVDQSAPLSMVMIADRIWRSMSNQENLLATRFTFLATMQGQSEMWRRDFLDIRRREMIDYGYLFRAEIVLDSASSDENGDLEVGIVSGQDPHFFGRLINATKSIGERTGLKTNIKKVEGGVEELDLDQPFQWFTEADMDRPGEAHFATQRLLGEQHLTQLRAEAGEFSSSILEIALQEAFLLNDEEVKTQMEQVGEGLVIASMSSLGTAILIWDGQDRVDVNVFSYEPDFVRQVILTFRDRCGAKAVTLSQLALDEMPRGLGRVINLQRDLA